MAKYLYCIIRSEVPHVFDCPQVLGDEGSDVYTVHHRDLAVVVSDSESIWFDSSRRNMLVHTEVTEVVMKDHTLLPVRFGSIMPDEETIKKDLLEARYNEIDDLLVKMNNQIEMGVKSFWYEEKLFKEILEENDPIRNLRDSLVGKSAEASYRERMRLGEMIEGSIERKRSVESEKILAALRPLASDISLQDIIVDRMVLNAAFLIDRNNESVFDEAMKGLGTSHSDRMLFKYIGPAPPYNFVNLTI